MPVKHYILTKTGDCRLKKIIWFISGAALLLQLGVTAHAGDCQKEALAAVSKYGIKDLHLFWVDKRGENNSKALLFWYETSLCGSSGYVNVTTNENCYVNEVFTRYRCVIPGLTRYY